MIPRRSLLATATLAAVSRPALAALPVPPSGKIGFRILRKGDVVGTHQLTFTTNGDALAVAVEIDFVVKLGPIPVFRYSHRATESWQGGQFVALESKTNHDGDPQFVHARREAAGVVVEGSKTQRYTAPPEALPTTYWNKAMLAAHVINSEDGRLFAVKPAALAEESVPLASGATIRARHYTLSGELDLDLWYDAADQWAHLVFSSQNNTFVYEKL
jgi:hypothetical protein